MSNIVKPIDLGFAEECESYLLKNNFFASKLGGLPSFLDLKNIPEQTDLLCGECGEPCAFLCQIYAPSETEARAFHRTIFLFICKNGACCKENSSKNIFVFRNQLERKNDFYSFDPPDDAMETEEVASPVKLCHVCGCRGPLACAKCKTINYCGPTHQKIDWRCGHKESCNKTEINEFLFPEFEIVIEREEVDKSNKVESDKDAEKRRLKDYEDLKSAGNIGEMSEISEADLSEFAESREDKVFGKFKKVIAANPEQIIRYSRGGSPLWISNHETLNENKIPSCEICNESRTFEFQIMPQMLNSLKNYDLDWGVILVYTCKNDCDVNSKYVKEFCFKQDIVKKDDNELDIEKLQSKVSKMKTNEPSSAPKVKNATKVEVKTEKPGQSKSSTAFAVDDDWE